MNIKKYLILSFIALSVIFAGCGKEEPAPIYISGELDVQGEEIGPCFVTVSRAGDADAIKENPMDYVIEMSAVDPISHQFNIDLSQTDLKPNDEIFLLAFIDNDYKGGIPNPTKGDYIGFYYDKEAFSVSYKLKEGANENISIRVKRYVYDYEASVSGTILGSDQGDVVITAYAGELTSFDIETFDVDSVIGYKKISKGSSPEPFTMSIMPYGFNVPVENVFLMAFLDKNANGKPDGGDLMGFYTDNDKNLPGLLQIIEDEIKNKNINFNMTMSAASNYNVALSGTIEMPAGEYYSKNTKPVYLFIAASDNLSTALDDPINAIKYFSKIEAPEIASNTVDFTVDLSKTDLTAGDKITIMAIWDKNFEGGLPYPDIVNGVPDYIGIYSNPNELSPSYTLKATSNDEIYIKLNRQVYDFEAYITGTVQTGTQSAGKVIVGAYAGEISSFDIKTAMNIDSIVGYTEITKGSVADLPYSLKILPYGKNLPMDVYLFAMFDKNGNGIPDGGDVVGFYSSSDGLPAKVNITSGTTSNKNIKLSMTLSDPSNYKIPLTGTVTMPAGMTYSASSASKVYLIVASEADSSSLMNGFNVSGLSMTPYFTTLAKPATASSTINYSLDLSQTGFKAGDKVIVAAMLDIDGAGLSAPAVGDYIGFYIDTNNLSPAYTLSSTSNTPVNINLSRYVNNFTASVSGSIQGSGTGNVIVVGYAGEIASFDFKTGLNMDNVVGYSEITKSSDTTPYTLNIMPYGKNIPMNIYLFAVLDINANGIPDGGDVVGFYSSSDGMPSKLTISGGALTGKDIKLGLTLSIPSNYNIPLTGNVILPSGHTYSTASVSNIYLVIASEADTNALMNGFDLSSMTKAPYFTTLTKPSTATSTVSFNVNLSQTGFKATDKVIIVAMLDTDGAGLSAPVIGDHVGFYVNTTNMSPAYTLSATSNPPVSIALSRDVYDFTASVSGNIRGDETGKVIVMAYAGEINWLSMKDINFNDVIGYTTITKSAYSTAYTLNIMDYGKNIPIQNVYIMAILDKNANGIPDAGDVIGFHLDPASEMQMPKLITINAGNLAGIDIDLLIDIATPSTQTITLNGTFTAPPVAYSTFAARPVFIFVAQPEGNDPSTLFDNPLDSIKQFCKVIGGATSFTMDLTGTGLKAGDQVMVIGVWDHDYTGGFLDLTADDYVAYLWKKSEIRMNITLTAGVNTVPASGFEFKFNKRVYEHNSTINYSLGTVDNNMYPLIPIPPLTPPSIGDRVVVAAIQGAGLDITSNAITDLDYIIGLSLIDIDSSNSYQLRIFPTVYTGITVKSPFAIDGVYVVAFVDKNRDFDVGGSGTGELLGYYWQYVWPTSYLPRSYNLKNGVNTLPVGSDMAGCPVVPNTAPVAFFF